LHFSPIPLTFRHRYTPFTETQFKGHADEFVGKEHGRPGVSNSSTDLVVVTEESLSVVDTGGVVAVDVDSGVATVGDRALLAVFSLAVEV
jgi:hypothetical protein